MLEIDRVWDKFEMLVTDLEWWSPFSTLKKSPSQIVTITDQHNDVTNITETKYFISIGLYYQLSVTRVINLNSGSRQNFVPIFAGAKRL